MLTIRIRLRRTAQPLQLLVMERHDGRSARLSPAPLTSGGGRSGRATERCKGAHAEQSNQLSKYPRNRDEVTTTKQIAIDQQSRRTKRGIYQEIQKRRGVRFGNVANSGDSSAQAVTN
jgi:hypothetical protein